MADGDMVWARLTDDNLGEIRSFCAELLRWPGGWHKVEARSGQVRWLGTRGDIEWFLRRLDNPNWKVVIDA